MKAPIFGGRIKFPSVVIPIVLWSLSLSAQIFVANNSGTISSYSHSGQLLNASFITGLYGPTALAYDNGYLYTASIVANGDTRAVIGKYTLSGTLVNASLLGGPQQYFPAALAARNGDLYVAFNSGTVMSYNATTGQPYYLSTLAPLGTYPGGLTFGPNGHLYATSGYGSLTEFTTSGNIINQWSIPSLGYPGGLVVDENYIYARSQSGNISRFTLAGVPSNLNLVSGLSDTHGIAFDLNGNLLEVDAFQNRVGRYSVTGATISANFITAGLSYPVAILVVPEPGGPALMLVGAMCLWIRRHYARR